MQMHMKYAQSSPTKRRYEHDVNSQLTCTSDVIQPRPSASLNDFTVSETLSGMNLFKRLPAVVVRDC